MPCLVRLLVQVTSRPLVALHHKVNTQINFNAVIFCNTSRIAATNCCLIHYCICRINANEYILQHAAARYQMFYGFCMGIA